MAGARLLLVDGPSGAGKTTLALAVAEHSPWPTRVVHADELYDGWAGLAAVVPQLDTLLRPLAAGGSGTYRRYDWHAGRYADEVAVDLEPDGLLVVEGVGSGALPTRDLATALVWAQAPAETCRERGLARDGAAYAPHWDAWHAQETAHHAGHRTRAASDLVVRTG
ncbi:MAG: 4-amino-4-deoxy-L-arabinose transferase [Nocardioides sp.]|nr:4-amino-4-deoxy-L-arabinose transferase [Nocardioides sp.]